MNENYYYFLASSSLVLITTGAVILYLTSRESQKEPAAAAPNVINALADHKKMCYVAATVMLVVGGVTLWGVTYESPIQRISLRG